MTPYDVLCRVPDQARPLVTHYAGPDSRVELSVATARNGVAKAAGLLRDGLGLLPGGVVSVELPRHWQLPIWVWAALSAGATCTRGELPELAEPDVRVVGPDALADLEVGHAEVLVCSCDAFGMPLPGGVPPGVLDAGVEVRAHPDRLQVDPAASAQAALVVAGRVQPWAPWGTGSPATASPRRIWVDELTPEHALLGTLAVDVLAPGASVVIATALAEEQARRLQSVEGVSEVLR